MSKKEVKVWGGLGEKKSNKNLQFKYVAQPKPKKTLYLTESQKRRALERCAM